VVGASHSAFTIKTHVEPSHLRLDGLFFGVFLSYAFHRHPIKFLSAARRFRYLLAGIGVLLLLPAFYFPRHTPFIFTYGLTLFYLGSGCLLVAALGWQTPTTRIASAVAYTGSHSYSVYLWHMPVALVAFAVINNWFIYAATYLIGSIAFGVGMAILT